MVDREIVEIEIRYYSILESYYSDLYKEYLNCSKNIDMAIKKYCNQQPNLYLPGNKDILTYKRKKFIEEIIAFWNEHLEMVSSFIMSVPSVGIFGIGDGYSNEFHNEISRNALFYDVLVFNDPFRAIPNAHEFEMKQNEQLFLEMCYM